MGQLVSSWLSGMPGACCLSHWLMVPSHTTVLWWVFTCSYAVSSAASWVDGSLESLYGCCRAGISGETPNLACFHMGVIASKVDRYPGMPHLLGLLGAPPSLPAEPPPWSGAQACGT